MNENIKQNRNKQQCNIFKIKYIQKYNKCYNPLKNQSLSNRFNERVQHAGKQK